MRIHHFLAWMAVLALSLAVSKLFLGDEYFATVADTPSLVGNLISSMAVTVLAFGFTWYHRDKAFFNEPGHGLLLVCCYSFVWSLCFRVIFDFLRYLYPSATLLPPDGSPPLFRWFIYWGPTLGAAAGILLNLVCAIWIAAERRWVRFYVFSAIVLAMELIVSHLLFRWQVNPPYQLSHFYYVIPLLSIAAYLFCIVVADWSDGLTRHWSHWCGVCVVLVTTLITVVSEISAYLYPRVWTSYPPIGG